MKRLMETDFYGSVVVGERGQIAIPKEARDEHKIKPGDKLIVMGHPGKGIFLAKADMVKELAKQLLKNV
ncbi:AbrB/MazE/SpoVT family DNA-binding domain-containing protein [Candidatus Micrarchaeota archaeon]|nr:AbrB/MazE/SpoVT family DNA-binding domain-containing protein [Candidatus Micrarchaeota archaeon]